MTIEYVSLTWQMCSCRVKHTWQCLSRYHTDHGFWGKGCDHWSQLFYQRLGSSEDMWVDIPFGCMIQLGLWTDFLRSSFVSTGFLIAKDCSENWFHLITILCHVANLFFRPYYCEAQYLDRTCFFEPPKNIMVHLFHPIYFFRSKYFLESQNWSLVQN